MKFFSLFFGKEVHGAPGKKAIPSEEFSTLADAAAIVEEVKREANEFKKEVAREAEKEKEKGFQEGFQEGLVALNQHIAAIDQELKKIREDVQKKILPLALTAARKIIGEELRTYPDRIADIVLTALKPVTQHRRITIYVNKADLEFVEASRPKIKMLFEHLENLSIQERSDIEPGGCIIETEAGIINAQLENQWRAMEAAFATFTST